MEKERKGGMKGISVLIRIGSSCQDSSPLQIVNLGLEGFHGVNLGFEGF